MRLNIGEHIRSLRRTANMTQAQLAESLGVSFQSVSRWEKGTAYPEIGFLPEIAKIFGTSIDELMGYTPTENGESAHMAATPNVIYTNSLNIGIVSSNSCQESQIATVEGADDPCTVPKSPVTVFTGCLTTHEMKQCGATYRLAILRYTCGNNNAANADFYVIKNDGLHRLENANRDQVYSLSADFSVDCNNCTITDRANSTTYCFDFVNACFTAE